MEVLLVDDDLTLIDSIQEVLSIYNICAQPITSKSRFTRTNIEDIDCIFLDFFMNEWDGMEAIEILKNKAYSGGLVLMSGMSEQALKAFENQAKNAGMDLWGILEKPLHVNAIVDVLNSKLICKDRDQNLPTKKDIKSALENNGCITLFQPKVELQTGSIIGFEALSRLKLNNGRMLFPDLFIGLIEKYDLSELFNKVMIRTALNDIQNSEFKNYPISLNFSIDHLMCPTLIPRLIREISVFDYDFSHLTVEVIEDNAIRDNEKVANSLNYLKSMGVKISLDDFGSGFNSFRQLSDYGFNEIKLDKHYVQNFVNDPKCEAILMSALNISKTLDVSLVLEGIETIEQCNCAQQLGAKLGQGYLFGKPEEINHQTIKTLLPHD